jgi:hypothetical protein
LPALNLLAVSRQLSETPLTLKAIDGFPTSKTDRLFWEKPLAFSCAFGVPRWLTAECRLSELKPTLIYRVRLIGGKPEFRAAKQ